MEGRLRVGACLSLSGRFARFGRQAAQGLEAWRSLQGGAELVIDDDRSDPRTLKEVLPGVAAWCDVLLGPYSTILMRAAGRMAAEHGWLLWNQGGSGDEACPGHVVPVLTPASRYAEPFIRYLADHDDSKRDLCVVHGQGRFGRQVADGAAAAAARSGIRVMRAEADGFPPPGLPREWDLFSAGVFEQDAELVARALQLRDPPRRVCTIAAGVREFASAVDEPSGVFGIAQWFPGAGHEVLLGPDEGEFLHAYADAYIGVPDYPAAQAAAGAVIAAHCARLAGSTRREDLWAAAADLDTSTFFGSFRIDPATGTQVKHQTALVEWTDGERMAVPAS
jgi:Periplasmic binding protein